MSIDNTLKLKFKKVLEKEQVFKLQELLSKKFKNCETYLVGGSVRDILLNRSIKDIDILIRGIKIKDLESELKHFGKVNLVGRRFSVIKFSFKGSNSQLDIAIPRRDFAYGTGGYKDFIIKSNPNLPIEEDLARRDFTINAIAYNVKENKLTDPFNGLGDLSLKIIRTVGNPNERFKEDYSRMLRAIRFSMQLDFKIEIKTLMSIKNNISKINSKTKEGERKVALEIISAEFLKAFDAKEKQTIEIYDKVNALQFIMPELLKLKKCNQPKEFHAEGDVWKHTFLALDMIYTPKFKKYFKEKLSISAKVALLLHDIGKPKTRAIFNGKMRFKNHDKVGAEITKIILNRLKASSDPILGVNIEEVVLLIKNHLIFCYSDPKDMKKTTLEKYLFNDKFSGDALLQLFLADALATRPYGQDSDLTHFQTVFKFKKELAKKRNIYSPKALLRGNEVMKILNIKSGPDVGKILLDLREEQLKGKIKNKLEAKRYIKSCT